MKRDSRETGGVEIAEDEAGLAEPADLIPQLSRVERAPLRWCERDLAASDDFAER